MGRQRVRKGIVQSVQAFFFARYTPAQLKEESFSVILSNDSESCIGLAALVTFAQHQREPFNVFVTQSTFETLNDNLRSLIAELKVPVVDCAGTCDLFPYCQEHSAVVSVAQLFDENENECGQLLERAPYKKLHFMANVPEARIVQQVQEWRESFIPFAKQTKLIQEVANFMTKSSQINYLAAPNIQKAVLLLQQRHGTDTDLSFNVRPQESIAQWLRTSGCDNRHFTVAFSGGKDSGALILALLSYKYANNLSDMEVNAVTFDPRLPGFNINKIQNVYTQLQQIAKNRFGLQLADLNIIHFNLANLIEEQNIESACPACARMRRGCIAKFCLEHNSVLTLGHHMDDFAETALMTAIHSGGFFGLRQLYQGTSGETIARPLIYCRQQQIRDYLKEMSADQIQFVSSDAAECNLAAKIEKESERKRIRQFISAQHTLAMKSLAECFLTDCTKSELQKMETSQ